MASLFVAQGDQGIDVGRAARRMVTGGKSHNPKKHCNCGERERIKRADSIKKAGKIARHAERSQDTEDCANG